MEIEVIGGLGECCIDFDLVGEVCDFGIDC